MRGKWCEFVRFICGRATGGVLLPHKWASDSMGFTGKNRRGGPVRKTSAREKNSLFYIGSVRGTTVLIPLDITEDVVKLVAWKFLGSTGPEGTDSEALQGWILQFGGQRKTLLLVWNMLWTG